MIFFVVGCERLLLWYVVDRSVTQYYRTTHRVTPTLPTPPLQPSGPYTPVVPGECNKSFYSLGRRVDFDVVDDVVREALDDDVRECCSHHHWGGALLKLHLLDLHRLGRREVELGDAGPHQRSQVLECLKCES